MFQAICSHSLTCDFQSVPVEGVYALSHGQAWTGNMANGIQEDGIHHILMEALNTPI